ncbi:MAG TPA: hypothetical protein VK892_20840 [Pyrinomonadaceae bacterium]|nr:hypothetical protein [Pyrinomonadaceae bacterium]
MGKKNNVNPDHYKTAGREKPGEDIVHEVHKQKYTQAQSSQLGSDFMPNSQFDENKKTKAGHAETGEVNSSANSSSND